MSLTRPARALAAGAALALALTACGGNDPTPAAGPDSPTAPPAPDALATASPDDEQSGERAIDTDAPEVLVTGLQVPWGLAFLPSGDALLTERDTGRLMRVPADGGAPTAVTRFDDVDDTGEGGLMGLAVSPDEPEVVYAYYTGPSDNRVVRFRADAPEDREPVVTGIPKGRNHNGGRIVFGPDGNLYVGTGDAGQSSLAQDDESLAGKVLRVTPDGEPVGGSRVFSSGHRNVQGLSFDDDGRLWAVEFGPERDDEVNQVREGDNAGWPEVTGDDDGDGRFLPAAYTWRDVSTASPSGSALVGDTLYVAGLRGNRLWLVPLDGGSVAGEPRAVLEGGFGRLRTVQEAPDGSLWVLTSNRDGRGSPADEDDRILRLPAR
jgi:glucose/arabinose dehydrogenase